MPIFAALAAAAPSLLSAGAGIAGNVISGQNTSKAIKDAAAAQALATDQGIGAINGNSQQTANLFAPYLNSGSNALSNLNVLLGLGAPSMSPAQGTGGGLSTTPSWSAYVDNNPDVLQAYNTTGKAQGTSKDAFGQWHWSQFGQNEHQAGDPNRTFTPYGQTQAAQAPGQDAGGPAAPQLSPQAQQQAAIDQLKASPLYQSLFHNGEQTVLANGAATGGLRGGNTERSLYNVGNDTLAQVIQNQVANLGGLAGAGQSAAGTVAGYNTQGTGGIVNLLNQGGANSAGAILSGNNANNSMINGLSTGIGSLLGNGQLMSALGLGGGIKTSTSNILGGDNYRGQSISANPASLGPLNTTLPNLSF